jgi:hypothetical protein
MFILNFSNLSISFKIKFIENIMIILETRFNLILVKLIVSFTMFYNLIYVFSFVNHLFFLGTGLFFTIVLSFVLVFIIILSFFIEFI